MPRARAALALVVAVTAFAVGLGGDLLLRSGSGSTPEPEPAPVRLGLTVTDQLVRSTGPGTGTVSMRVVVDNRSTEPVRLVSVALPGTALTAEPDADLAAGAGMPVDLDAPLVCGDAGAETKVPTTFSLEVTVRDGAGVRTTLPVPADQVDGLLGLGPSVLDPACGVVPVGQELWALVTGAVGGDLPVQLQNRSRLPQRVVGITVDGPAEVTLRQDGVPVVLPLLLPPFAAEAGLVLRVVCSRPTARLLVALRTDGGPGTRERPVDIPLPTVGSCAF